MSGHARLGRGLLAATLSMGALIVLGRVAAGLLAGRLELDPVSVREFFALAVAGWALLSVAAALVLLRARWWAWLFALPLWWLGVETFVSPYLARLFNLRAYYYVLDVDHLPIDGNSDNIRSEREPEEFTPDGLNIIFLGDSFTYGFGLEPEQTFVHRVEELLDAEHPDVPVRTANFAWTSSSPLLLHRRIVSIGDRYSPDLVVLCVDMTDFHDDVKYGNMLEQRGVYGVYDKLPLTLQALRRLRPRLFSRWWAWTNQNIPARPFFITEQPLEQSRPHMQALVRNMDAIGGWCAQRDVPLVVFILPRHYQYSDREAPGSWERGKYEVLGPYSREPFRFFEELATTRPYPIHSLLPAFLETDVFPTCFEHDPHWNADGARVAADAIAAILREEIAARVPDPAQR